MGISATIYVRRVNEAGIVIGHIMFVILRGLRRERISMQIRRSMKFCVEPWDNRVPFRVWPGLERTRAGVENISRRRLREALVIKGQLVAIHLPLHYPSSLSIDRHRRRGKAGPNIFDIGFIIA